MASRLSEDKDTSVLLVESGKDFGECPAAPIPAGFGKLFYNEFDWQMGYKQTGLEGEVVAPRGHVMGGSSSLNCTWYQRGPRSDYDRWVKDTEISSLSYDSLTK